MNCFFFKNAPPMAQVRQHKRRFTVIYGDPLVH